MAPDALGGLGHVVENRADVYAGLGTVRWSCSNAPGSPTDIGYIAGLPRRSSHGSNLDCPLARSIKCAVVADRGYSVTGEQAMADFKAQCAGPAPERHASVVKVRLNAFQPIFIPRLLHPGSRDRVF